MIGRRDTDFAIGGLIKTRLPQSAVIGLAHPQLGLDRLAGEADLAPRNILAPGKPHLRPMGLDGIGGLEVGNPVTLSDRRNRRFRSPGIVQALGDVRDDGRGRVHERAPMPVIIWPGAISARFWPDYR